MPTSSDPATAPAIEVRGLGKQYRLGSPLDAFDIGIGFRRLLGAPGRVASKLAGREEKRPTIWAVKDVDLDVRPGEVLGLIGKNGAGKSTLLKLLARITEPTEGRFVLRGRTASLLQIGVGFHSEFTGRENVYFSGTVLGMRKREIDRRFDEIVAYAGLEEFIDTPTKRYSSGMYVRLAFAVAAHLEAEILLIDEVLAVGDAEFRRRARDTLEALARSGRTIVLVSHNMETIRDIASRVVLLDQGGVATDGPAEEVVAEYLAPGGLSMEPTIETLEARPVLGIRQHTRMAEIGKVLGALIPQVMAVAGPHCTGTILARWHSWEDDQGDMEVAAPVREPLPDQGAIKASALPAGPAVVYTHVGPYDDLPQAWKFVRAWVEGHGKVGRDAPWEEYLDDPGEVPAEKLRTRIVWPIEG